MEKLCLDCLFAASVRIRVSERYAKTAATELSRAVTIYITHVLKHPKRYQRQETTITNERRNFIVENIARKAWGHHYPFGNRELSGHGSIGRHGIAALHTHVAIFRHYRKKAGIKGAICKPVEVAHFRYSHDTSPFHDYFVAFEHRLDRLREFDKCRAAEIESWDQTGLACDYGSAKYPYVWLHDLMIRDYDHLGYPIKTRQKIRAWIKERYR